MINPTQTERFGIPFSTLHGRRNTQASALTIGGQQLSNRPSFSNATQMLQMRFALDNMESSIETMRRNLRNPEVTRTELNDRLDEFMQNNPLPDRPMSRHIMQESNPSIYQNAEDLATNAGFDLGKNTLSLRIGDLTFDFSFTVSATDTRQDVQQRVANAINEWAAGTAINATVDVDSNGNSTLAVEFDTFISQDSTGRVNVDIVLESGMNVIASGVEDENRWLENVLRFAQDFLEIFQDTFAMALNPTAFSADNSEAVEAHIRGLAQIHTTMNNFVSAFNSLIELGNENELSQRLHDMLDDYQDDLSQIGIAANDRGFLRIDNRMLTQSFTNGTLHNSSFSSFLSRIGDIVRSLHTPQGAIFDKAV
ncbi:MAG: hypothetical protein FWG65_04085 [Turicibacter sp.]|nr:hypothetical protein [Turicibacter sp.]